MKKVLLSLFMIILLFGITGCQKEQTDSLKFKEEYESLNHTVNEKNGKEYREVSISKENPMVYATAEEISKMIDEKESFYVYFGFPGCPWCRSMLEEMLQAAKDHQIGKIYYVNVLDIRDTKEVVEGVIQTTKEGDPYYLKLLDQLKDVLADYSLTDEDNNPIEVGEKRIYAPNVVAVVNGEAKQLTEGISEDLKDPYGELTEKMKKDSYHQLDCIFKCLEESTMCQKKSC